MTRTSNRPLPDGHPLKGGLIIFGAKRPASSVKPSTSEEPPIPKQDVTYQPQQEEVNTAERDEEPAPYKVRRQFDLNRPEEDD